MDQPETAEATRNYPPEQTPGCDSRALSGGWAATGWRGSSCSTLFVINRGISGDEN